MNEIVSHLEALHTLQQIHDLSPITTYKVVGYNQLEIDDSTNYIETLWQKILDLSYTIDKMLVSYHETYYDGVVQLSENVWVVGNSPSADKRIAYIYTNTPHPRVHEMEYYMYSMIYENTPRMRNDDDLFFYFIERWLKDYRSKTQLKIVSPKIGDVNVVFCMMPNGKVQSYSYSFEQEKQIDVPRVYRTDTELIVSMCRLHNKLDGWSVYSSNDDGPGKKIGYLIDSVVSE